jgi:hypothetical protein
MYLRDDRSALSDCGRHTFGRAGTNIADRKNARHTCLQQKRWTPRCIRTTGKCAARQKKTLVVHRRGVGEPVRMRIGADKQE